MWWEKVKSYREVKKVIRTNADPVVKEQVFLHFANRTDKLGRKIFADMISDEFYSASGVARIFFYGGLMDNITVKRSKELILDFIEPAITMPKLDGRDMLFDDRYYLRLEYFALKDREKFKQLYEKLPPLTAFRRYFVDKPNVEVQRKMFAVNRNHALTGAVDYYAWRMEDDFEFRRWMKNDKGFGDWTLLENLVKSSDQTNLIRLLELDIVPVGEVKARFTPAVMERKTALKHYISPDRWKYFNNPNFVYNNIPAGKQWEVFDYMAEHNPEVARYFANNYSEFYAAKIEAHYKGRSLSRMPAQMRAIVAEQIKKAQENREKARVRAYSLHPHTSTEDLVWTENGELKKYFTLADGRPVKTREEYMAIANKYVNSGMSALVFCKKYKISDTKSFEEFLRNVASIDDDLREALRKKKEGEIEHSVDTKFAVLAVVLEQASVGEILPMLDPKTQNLARVIDFIDETYSNPSVKRKFMTEVIKHYYLKLNSCGISLDEENLAKRLNNAEMQFILGIEGMEKVRQEKEYDIAASFIKMTANAREGLKDPFEKYVFGKGARTISTRIKNYDLYFDSSRALGMHIGSVDGPSIEVTREVLGQAEAFRAKYDLYPSNRTMTSIIRGIAAGEIKIDPVHKLTRTEAVAEARGKAAVVETIDEYFDVFDQA